MEEGTERNPYGIHSFPRDLLRGFAGNACVIDEQRRQQQQQREAAAGDSDEIELSLGLSLGGCFGEDPKGKKLVRSSSIASFSSPPWEPPELPPAFPSLARASSLPSETQEELRKRKEFQSLKRLEAKRKRLERRNSIKSGATAKAVEKPQEVGVTASASASPMATEDCVGLASGTQYGTEARNAAATPGWPPGASFLPPATQRSIGSQGSCSSGASGQGFGGISRSNSCNMSVPLANGKILAESAAGGMEGEGSDPSRKAAGARGPNGTTTSTSSKEKSMMEQMPCVSTTGDGPNGRRVDGFLYKYNKGDEVSIVCVCHGSFLTPAEFVKHAGGGDVAHPLRHIVVNPSSFASSS